MPYSMHIHRTLLACLLGLLAALGAGNAAAQSLEVIELKHRSAAEMIPVLQPLVEAGGALTGQDYKLFVRASSGNIAQLRKAVAQLDRAARQFLVSVRRATQQEIQQEQAAAAARVGSGGGSVTLSTNQSRSLREGNGVQSVQVLEGSSAFIATGSSVPMITSAVVGGGRRPVAGVTTEYRNISSGFTVTPRLAGEQVLLQIEQQAQRRGNNGEVQTQSLSTQVTGKLDEWLRLGGVEETAQSQSGGIASGSYSTRSSEQTIWIKVSQR